MARRVALVVALVLLTASTATAGRRRRRVEPKPAPPSSSAELLRADAHRAYPCLAAPGPSATKLRLLAAPETARRVAEVRALLVERAADKAALGEAVAPLLVAGKGTSPQSVLDALFLDYYQEAVERQLPPDQTGIAARTARSVAMQSLVRSAQALTAAAGRPGVAISSEPVYKPRPRAGR